MLESVHDLVVGTGNVKKGLELAQLLAPHGFRVTTLKEIDNPLEVEETGSTFAENARLKATEQARHLGRWVLADDSGIEVDALGGRPGVFSARYAGPSCDDQANNDKLLAELGEVPRARRGAQFVCSIVVSDPQGQVRATAQARCRGIILWEAAGTHGFGYDPLFEIPEYHKTFGQLGPRVKRLLSHRARAMRIIVPQLVALAAG